MKKKLLAVISFLIALVMSFCLIACGNKDDNKGGKGDGTKLTAAKLEAAIGKLENAKTLELDLAGSVDSRDSEAMNFEAKLELSGNRGKYTDTAAETSYIVDFETYYYYELGDDGKCVGYGQLMPSGINAYADDVMAELLGEAGDTGEAAAVDYAKVVEKFAYDKTYGGYVTTVEAKDNVNALLKFVQDAYADDLTLNDVVNDLLQKAAGDDTVTLEALLSLVCSEQGYGALKNVSLAALLGEDGDALFNEIYAALEEMGMELNAQQKAAIKNRKVGEVLAGVMSLLPDIMEGDFDPEALLTAVFFTPYTQDQINDVGTMLATYADMAIDFLKDAKVRDYIEMAPAEIQALVKNEFKFTAITGTFGFKFDGTNITEVMFDGYVAHNYAEDDADDFVFLGDNKYKAELTVGITAKDTVTSFDVEFADNVELRSMAQAMLRGYSNDDSVVYFETAGKDITVSDIKLYYFVESEYDNESMVEMQNANVIYNENTSCFVINSKKLQDFVDSEPYSNVMFVSFTFEVDDEEQYGNLYLTVMPDASFETLVDYVTEMVESFM